MQLGAFYPFSRNHNAISTKPQEPYLWDSVANKSRTALNIRYSILPYYYTLFYKVHTDSKPSAVVMKPLFFEFPSDSNTYDLDRQFMIGSAILISPILQQGANTINIYFPSGARWYDYYTLSVESETGGQTKTLPVTSDIPIHLRGGSIIPMHDPALTTVASRQTPLSLLILLDSNGQATGDLFYDDGEALDFNKYIFVDYTVRSGQLTSHVTGPGYTDISVLDTVTVVGLSTAPSTVSVNGKDYSHFTFNVNVLKVTDLNIDMNKPFTIKWS